MMNLDHPNDKQKCRICGCTWYTPCEGGCYWVKDDLCSKCAERLENERIQKMLNEAPDLCPITGLQKIESYVFDEGVVYGIAYPYNAYTLPVYNEEEQTFYRIKIDMDNDFQRTDEFLCSLDDLKGREDFEEIKKFYGIG